MLLPYCSAPATSISAFDTTKDLASTDDQPHRGGKQARLLSNLGKLYNKMGPGDLVICILVSQYIRTRWEVRSKGSSPASDLLHSD